MANINSLFKTGSVPNTGHSKGGVSVKEKQLVNQMTREDLEDRYLTLSDDHLETKRHSRKQEERMRQMATKLLRLAKDRKKLAEGSDGGKIELSEKLEETESQNRELSKQNEGLRNKLTVARQQLHTHARRQTPYGHVKSKVRQHSRSTSAQPTQRIDSRAQDQMTPEPRFDRPTSTPTPALPQPRYGHSLLENVRIEKEDLKNQVSHLQDEVNSMKDEVEEYKQLLRRKELDHEEDLQAIQAQITGTQKSNIQENVELIKLQREVKDKSRRLQSLQSNYESVDQTLTKLKQSHEEVLNEMEQLSTRLTDEQSRSAALQSELRKATVIHNAVAQKDDQIKDLRSEVGLLKDAHQKLMKSTFTVQREQEFRSKEKQYELKMAELQNVIQADVTQKNDLLDRLSQEQGSVDKTSSEYRQLQVAHLTLKEEYDEMKQKMTFLEMESKVDSGELREALLLVQKKREAAQRQGLDFLAAIDDEADRGLQERLHQIQASHADTINELEKTRRMLKMQHDINKDYEKEVHVANRNLSDLRRECDARLQEDAQLLDVRAAKIKKLERQLRDIAYGTKQYPMQPPDSEEADDIDAQVELERGQNVFEIHIGEVHLLNKDASAVAGAEPSIFVTFDFFEHELQITPVMRGAKVDFNMTAQYIVQVDDFFLHFLYKASSQVELHQAIGTEYHSLASGALRFNDVLAGHQGRAHFSLRLQGTDSGADVAMVEGWARLRVPMEQALRLYKERSKAIGYMYSNAATSFASGDPGAQTTRLDAGTNELKVLVLRCSDLVSRQPGVQPSAYAVYSFYDFPDYDTPIVPHSNQPQFNSTGSFPVPMSEDLDNYLKSKTFDIFVFDDNDTTSSAPLGVASVPLLSLSHDKPIEGTFQLKQVDGTPCGSVDIQLRWSVSYLPGSRVVATIPKLVSDDDPAGDVVSAASSLTSSVAAPRPSPRRPQLSSPASPPCVTSPPLDTPRMLKEEAIPAGSGEDNIRATSHQQQHGSDMTLETKEESVVQEHGTLPSADHQPPPPMDNYTAQEATQGTSDHREQDPPTQSTKFTEPIQDSDSDDDLVVSTATFTKEATTDHDDTDSDDVVVVASAEETKGTGRVTHGMTDVVTITVSSLMFFDNASVLAMDSLTQFFVSYRFLDVDPEQLETPVSLPKPPPNRPMSFNFKRVFHVDEASHADARQRLRNMLTAQDAIDARIYFTVVSDPADDQDGTCQDVAIAYVDLVEVLQRGRDMTDEDIDVVDLMANNDVIGALTVSVECIDALRSFYQPS